MSLPCGECKRDLMLVEHDRSCSSWTPHTCICGHDLDEHRKDKGTHPCQRCVCRNWETNTIMMQLEIKRSSCPTCGCVASVRPCIKPEHKGKDHSTYIFDPLPDGSGSFWPPKCVSCPDEFHNHVEPKPPSTEAMEEAKKHVDHFSVDEDNWYTCPMHPEALRRPDPLRCDCAYEERLLRLAKAFDAFRAAK